MSSRRSPAPSAHSVKGGELGFFSRLTYHSLHGAARVCALIYFRAWAHNSSALPRKGMVIVAPVHRSNLDVPLLGATCPRRLRYLAKDSLFKTRFWAWFLTAVGGFPLEREASADRAALSAAVSVLERGEALVVFPEGERKDGPVVHPMADGAMWLAGRTGAPILPVAIGGSGRAMPKGSTFPKPKKLVFLYGDLVPAPVPAPGKSRVSRAELRALSSDLRTILQDLFDEAQALAGVDDR